MDKVKIYLGRFCPYCDTILKNDKHICVVFINGYPSTGKNHLKEPFEIQEAIGKTT